MTETPRGTQSITELPQLSVGFGTVLLGINWADEECLIRFTTKQSFSHKPISEI